MTEETASCAEKPWHDIFDFTHAQAILGKRITGVMLKRRKAETKHPENRMFLMFDDGTGFEFFGGLILPWNIHRDCDCKHVVRRRISAGEFVTTFFAGEPEGDEKCVTIDAMRKRKPGPVSNRQFDKSDVLEMLGKRISGIRLLTDPQHDWKNNLSFLFDNGTVYEFQIAGYIGTCRKTESFDLYRLLKRGMNVYENEVLVLSDPDGEGWVVVINKLYEWPEQEGKGR